MAALLLPGAVSAQDAVHQIVVTNDFAFEPGTSHAVRLVVRSSHVTIDGRGSSLVGPGRMGDLKSFESASVGVLVDGVTGVTVKNLKVRGFETGLVLRDTEAATVIECDFSDNYHNPQHGWGELPPRGGVILERTRRSVLRRNRANRVWDGLHLIESDESLIADNDFSRCSNTCAKLWRSCRNTFIANNFSYGLRIDRAAGEVHARDSTGVLIETGSDDNYWHGNDITHGGDGIFIRPLNRWVSRGNVFVENDTSYANNNCVESWSPGNTFIRNRANHGSYGFWLGGSDQTILIGNEAAFNGRPDGFHNAPEAGFGHGGIVIVGGSSSHTRIEGNNLHDNHGAGIAFRGDVQSQGQAWRAEHWIVQGNRITQNRVGVWGRWGSAILLAANTFAGNDQDLDIEETTDLIELPCAGFEAIEPKASLIGPQIVMTGQPARFDAGFSRDPLGRPLQFLWWLGGAAGHEVQFERTFTEPGFYRLSLTVHNGALGSLAWRDLLVVAPVARELGTDGPAHDWGFELEGNEGGRGRVWFAEDTPGLVGRCCLRVTPNPYPGSYATAIYPNSRDAGWDFTGKQQIRFWIKAQNPNLPGWQNAGPVVRLAGPGGVFEYKPAKDGNLMNDPPSSEARWQWMPVVIPLAGDAHWQRSVTGNVALRRIDAFSLALDSWGGDPFTIWIDGLAVE